MKYLFIVSIILSSVFASDFIKKQNIVIDNKNNIMWQDNNDVVLYKENITMANVYCENLILNGYIDWKFPSIKQLSMIIDVKSKKSAITKEFKFIKNDKYWTNTPYVNMKDNFWYVDFTNGKINFTSEIQEYQVRCYRDIK